MHEPTTANKRALRLPVRCAPLSGTGSNGLPPPPLGRVCAAALLVVVDDVNVDGELIKLCAPCVVAVVALGDCPGLKGVDLGPVAVMDVAETPSSSSPAALLLVLVAIDLEAEADVGVDAASPDVESGVVWVEVGEGARLSIDVDSGGDEDGDGAVLQMAATRRPFCASPSRDLVPVLTMAQDF
ncbi:hypothetical protein E4U54_001581 [Claviceps lovelessii]|nr:hypothetical protein E4U54_001581 [Claviceps lovelessii]